MVTGRRITLHFIVYFMSLHPLSCLFYWKTDRQAGQTDRQTDRRRERERERGRERQRDRKETETERDRETETETERARKREREREKREREREGEREREREREKRESSNVLRDIRKETLTLMQTRATPKKSQIHLIPKPVIITSI